MSCRLEISALTALTVLANRLTISIWTTLCGSFVKAERKWQLRLYTWLNLLVTTFLVPM